MTMLAETVDAVIGIDNDSAGFARLLAAIAEVVPGPRVAVCIEGSRSYGIGLVRVLAAAGLLVLECQQPSRKRRRGKGKSDPIDAHLAVLAALRLDAGKLPVPRADGDREALRILLVARQEITMARTAQIGRLRALLLAGDDTDRRTASKALTQTALAGRELPAQASPEQAVRHAEIRRLTLGMPVYFCDKASPWQRPSNENTNGLLRQYFPKSSDLRAHGPDDLAAVAAELNARPRKTLGWDTPAARLGL